jgi:NO-binding membrane sensor protein with MHYT domain
MLDNYFQLGTIPATAVYGTYDWPLVLLSYLVAIFASYIALDMAGRLQDANNTRRANLCWLFGGAFAMGAGIWSMHFIGMLAFHMAMPMSFNPFWTAVSLGVAILASFIALRLLMHKAIGWSHLMIGGLFLGIAISAMHYIGMYAMTDTMIIRYVPSLFFLSVLIALIAAEAALWLAVKSNQGTLRVKIRLKIISALIMGAAICGMHYTGMAAAIFFPKSCAAPIVNSLNPNMLSISIAGVTFIILGVAFVLSTYKEIANQQIITTARLAGMAEVSSNILHSVGNVLNSLNVSANSVGERIEHTKISELNTLSNLIQQNKNNLAQFFTQDPKAANIPTYLQVLAEYWQNEKSEILAEINSLLSNIQHIKDIISTQQSLGSFIMFEQTIEIQAVIKEAITIAEGSLGSDACTIKINKKFAAVKPFLLDKIKLLQILVNLLKNAKDSLLASNIAEKIILIKLSHMDEHTIIVQVIDNGIGIEQKNLIHLFKHGFSTKESGHGYGLHLSAILAKQMGGSLTGESLGKEQGATFNLILPYK